MRGELMSLLMNKDRIFKSMKEKGFDAIVASTPENILYLSDSPLSGYVVLPLEKNIDPFIITWVAYADKVVDSKTWIKDHRYSGTFFFEYFPENKLIELEKKDEG